MIYSRISKGGAYSNPWVVLLSNCDKREQNKTKYTMDPGIYFLMKTNN